MCSAAQVNNAALLHGMILTSKRKKQPKKQLYKSPHLHIDTYIGSSIWGAEHQSTQGKQLLIFENKSLSATLLLALFHLKMGQADPQAELITGMERCFWASVSSIWVNKSLLHQSSHQQSNAKFGRFRAKHKKNEEKNQIFSGAFPFPLFWFVFFSACFNLNKVGFTFLFFFAFRLQFALLKWMQSITRAW